MNAISLRPIAAFFPVLTLTVVLSFFSITPAKAASEDAAAAFVDGLGKKALSSLTAPELDAAEREKRVRSLLRSYFDINTIAKFSLGTNWRNATEAQRSEYLKLFEGMIVKTYAQRFSEYSGQDLKIGKATKVSETSSDIVVASQIIQPDGPPVSVEWRVRNKDGSMKIIDVIVERISMSVTQRSDFASVIQSGGGNIDALLESLRERAAK